VPGCDCDACRPGWPAPALPTVPTARPVTATKRKQNREAGARWRARNPDKQRAAEESWRERNQARIAGHNAREARGRSIALVVAKLEALT